MQHGLWFLFTKTLHGTKIVILILGIGFQATSRDNKNMDHLVGSRRVARIIPIKQVQHETVHNIILTYISNILTSGTFIKKSWYYTPPGVHFDVTVVTDVTVVMVAKNHAKEAMFLSYQTRTCIDGTIRIASEAQCGKQLDIVHISSFRINTLGRDNMKRIN